METLYLFNPENDLALACGSPYYMPPASVRRMAAELSVLPAWYAAPGGTVWVDSLQRGKLLEEQLPFPLSVCWASSASPSYIKVCPWGWNPSLVRCLSEAEFPASVYPSEEQMARLRWLSGRQTASAVLQRLHSLVPMVGEAFVLRSVEEVKQFVQSRHKALLKAPWSGSGRGIQHTSGVFSSSLHGWVKHVLTTQGELMGEPFYDRVLDFAMEFRSDGRGEVDFVGYSLFETDSRGAYKENLLAPDAAIEARVAAYISPEVLHQTCRALQAELAVTLGKDYGGYLGVDMMVCRMPSGEYALHPCVEINLRMNMGIVARLFYDRYVSNGSHGRYVVEHYAQPGEAWHLHLAFQKQYPLQVSENQIKSGYLSLTPVDADTAYQVYVLVEE